MDGRVTRGRAFRWGGARKWLACGAVLLLSACATMFAGGVSKKEFLSIENAVSGHIAHLASDEFMGRRPGTDGERLTLDYMVRQLAAYGLESGTNDPANPWLAPVTLISNTPIEGRVELKVGRKRFVLPEGDAAAFTTRRRSLVDGGEVIFVGWDADNVADDLVKGRVVLMVSTRGRNRDRRDNIFEKGASAVISVVGNREDLEDVRQFSGGERLLLPSEERDVLNAYVTEAAIADALGKSRWDKLVAASESDDFEPQLLKVLATVEASSAQREVVSHNLIGRLPGRIPQSGEVLLLAHWDHFGTCGAEADADRLCNGAADNASGVAVMLELARRLAEHGPYDRDVYVLGTTAEEWGLLGAKAFVEDPPMPLDSIVAAFNFDTVAIAPVGAPVGFVGEGRTPLDGVIAEVMSEMGRTLGSRVLAEQYLQRQDSWVLLQRDVPAVALSNAFGDEGALNPYLKTRYHRASDEIAGIELGGAVEDLLLHERIVRRLANLATYPATGE